MKVGFSQQEIITTAKSLGLPTDGFIQRRVARAFDLVESNKVTEIDDGIFRVRSQFDADKSYIVNVNHGDPSCDCPDGERTCHCKHRIASLLYLRNQAKQFTIYDDTKNSCNGRGRWIVTDYKARVKYIIYRDSKGNLHCPCNPRNRDCEHKKAIRNYLGNNGGNGTKITNDCGTTEAQTLQEKMNGQLDSSNSKGNGAQASSQPIQLDINDPFQESEQYDIDQIEGRRNGELAWKLSNGQYCISYAGIMRLAEKHDIEYSVSIKDDSNTIVAKAYCEGNERVSGKQINGFATTASELAKRNAARQLLPLPEIKAVEHKAKLEAEFDWNIAYHTCGRISGGKPQVDIIINDLVQAGKLRQDNPSHYDRTEWLIIHDACKDDSDGGDNFPSSTSDDGEVNLYKVLAEAPVNENWRERYDECVGLVGMSETDLIIRQQLNFRHSYYKNKITDDQWDIVLQECRYRWNARQRKMEFASLQQQYRYDHIQKKTGYDVRSKSYVGRPALNDDEFIAKCKGVIEKVRADNSVEANEMPIEGDNGKRKIQMDKKLNVWIVEVDGTKKSTSCREICEQFESQQNPSIVTRLRAGIDDGADISTVELDN